jgi:1-acyl-sn-glycerol-3-phosphate acyltransferase
MVTIPAVVTGCVIVTAMMPVLLVLAWLVDVVRSIGRGVQKTAVSMVLIAWTYLFMESSMLGVLGVLWLTAGFDAQRVQRLARRTAIAQRFWVATLFGATQFLFRLSVEVEGDDAFRAGGPVVIFARHASLIDVLLPTMFVTKKHGLLLRWVLKSELLMDPCLDVAGHWLRNHFVGRNGTDSEREINAVRALGDGMTASEGLLIYPEGTRFSPERRARLLASPDSERRTQAMLFNNVLPPRLGGPIALLDLTPEVDIVLMAHHGLESVTVFDDVWNAKLHGRTIRVQFWRIRGSDVPQGTEARIEWLNAQWMKVDAWVGAQSQPRDSNVAGESQRGM